MADERTPTLGELQDPCYRARKILSKMNRYRIDPRRLKMTESGPSGRGGQSTVSMATIMPPEEVPTWIPEERLTEVLNTTFAIKKLKFDPEDDGESVKVFKSFVNELSLMATISHPNIVKLVGFVENMREGHAWIVLRWEANGNVREFLRLGEWDIPEHISLIQDVANGAEYLHSREPPICHGDLKSLNILVDSSYHALITDFGSARIQRC
ncbi:hypothetical protein M407DRAFT_29974, partial [Tulasnella calospora MUT 4182]